MLVLLNLIYQTLKSLRVDVSKGLLKLFPMLAIPIFLVTSFSAIVLNDAMWNTAMDGIHSVQGGASSGKGGFLAVYSKMNYFFPISETLMMITTLVPLKIICVSIRIAKSFVPTIN